ncbi:hypothetical protein AA14337_3196 [Acetobacter malorum DSM 14337]|uniref:Uncharacterized protein n=1 Tax=Acetobacter malorum DSM 14337 TaxID=1307910 RepID=A0ABQ0Q079_9PROT|nr:hypothetical protein AA14337_3196 [Acetobacter malorum DSM 14337]
MTGNPILVEIQENFRADIRTRFVGKGRRTDEDAKASFLETRKSYALPDIPQEVKAEMHGAKMDARHSHLNSLMD